MVSHIGSPLSIMLLNWACVDKKEGLRSSRVYGRVSEWPCRLRSLIRDGKGGWWEVLLMPPALAARVSHTAVCENGLSFILNGPSQEAWFFFFFFFTTDLKLPTPGKGQRSYRRANDEMVVSTFPYLPLPYHVHSKNQSAKALTQSAQSLRTAGRWRMIL